jgi:putative transposase
MALRQRGPQKLSHHPDQACPHPSIAFGLRSEEAGLRPSMVSGADCYDNAMCESFCATLGCELLDGKRFRTRAEARMALFDSVDGW